MKIKKYVFFIIFSIVTLLSLSSCNSTKGAREPKHRHCDCPKFSTGLPDNGPGFLSSAGDKAI